MQTQNNSNPCTDPQNPPKTSHLVLVSEQLDFDFKPLDFWQCTDGCAVKMSVRKRLLKNSTGRNSGFTGRDINSKTFSYVVIGGDKV